MKTYLLKFNNISNIFKSLRFLPVIAFLTVLFAFSNNSYSQCNVQIQMNDSWGDGWNGGFLEVFFDGISQGTFAATGTGSTANLTIPAGQTMTVNYSSGSWEGENTYTISIGGSVVFSDGTFPSTGMVYSYNCPGGGGGSGSNCGVVIQMNDSWGDGWNGGFLEVFFNGVSQGTFAATGTGSTANLTIPAGQTMTVNYSSGSWEGENTYTISIGGSVVFSDGTFPSTGMVYSYNCPGGCSDTEVTLNMNDSWGDGWNGANLTITGDGGSTFGPFTFFTGFSSTETICLPDDCYSINVTSGTWPSEVSWTLTDGGTTLASGGAPDNQPQAFSTGSASCAPPYDPCTSIQNISSCGTSNTMSFSGNGAWDPISNTCGFNTPGQEQIYQFTAPQTGTYLLDVTTISGGWVDIFYKNTSSGCGNNDWTCFGPIENTGTYLGNNPLCFTAGQTYYIMFDPEFTTAGNLSFDLLCPTTPNISAPNVNICEGGSVNMTGTTHDVLEDAGEFYGYYWLASDDNGTTWYYQNVPDNTPGALGPPSYNTSQANSLNLTFNPGDAGNYLIEREHYDACGNLQVTNQLSVTVDEQSTAATSITGGGTYCLGNEVTLTVNGGSLGGSAQWEWFEGSCGTGVIGTGNSITVTPNTTTTYYVRASASGDCNATACVNTTVTVPTPNNQLSINNSSSTCVVNDNNFVHFLDGSGRLIASINSQGQNLGNVTATSYVEGTPLLIQDCATSILTSVMDRHWLIEPDVTNPGGPVIVRLPVNNTELNSLITESNANANPIDDVVGIGNVYLSKYSGPSNLDNDFDNNCPGNGGDGNVQIFPQTINGTVNSMGLFAGHPGTDLFIDYSIPDFSEFWLHGSDELSPLPVTFTDFSAECKENYTSVKWSTASEQNSSHFILERSVDGYNWREIGTIEAQGNSTSLVNYEYEDTKTGGLVYYRLMQFDNDGAYKELSPISTDCEIKTFDAKLYPNPTNELLNIELINAEFSLDNASIQIQDMQGRKVNAEILENTNSKKVLNVNNLEKGVYNVQIVIKEDNKVVNKRFTVN